MQDGGGRMILTPEQFGQLALQMLATAQIPGAQLETALAFRDLARSLADGQSEIVAKPEEAAAE